MEHVYLKGFFLSLRLRKLALHDADAAHQALCGLAVLTQLRLLTGRQILQQMQLSQHSGRTQDTWRTVERDLMSEIDEICKCKCEQKTLRAAAQKLRGR